VSFAAGDDYDRSTLDRVARRRDEIGDLASAFSRLVASLQVNVSQRVAIEGELNVAADIQQSLLPLTFPHQPEFTEFDLHAALVPAKEVGGDFYDFGEVGVDRYYFLVGDVSGKGVPAALFMAATKTLIRSGALSGEPVNQMLTRINAEIAASNPEFMFATVWMGVLDLRTGEVEFTNAGHNPPVLTVEDEPTFLTESHGPFIGPIPGVTYTSGRFTMPPGSRLIVYSDGITEAMNPAGDLFGEDRLVAMDLPTTVEGATTSIVDAALEWEEGTRSDDVTVLALDFHALRETVELAVTLTGEDALAAVSELNAAMEEFGRRHEIPPETAAKTMMALDEIVTNVLTHGGASTVTVTANWRDGWLVTTVADDGTPFDPLGAAAPDTTQSLHERDLGGLGIHLVRGVMTDVEYTYTDGRNVLTMKLHAT
jgi:serine phosphatase RsbU (regulator of sigma subunit)/anti-sigma regulatory factor (Ser/Thr protein kinase)